MTVKKPVDLNSIRVRCVHVDGKPVDRTFNFKIPKNLREWLGLSPEIAVDEHHHFAKFKKKMSNGLSPPPDSERFSFKPRPRQGNNGRVFRIRDNMDDVLEAKGLFRKHVADEPDSIFRAVSDALFGTQVYHSLVKRGWINSNFVDGEYPDHPVARALAKLFNLKIEIIQHNNENLDCTEITSKGKKGRKRRLQICFTPPHQYDPIYTREFIDTAGFVQSILYKLLYEDVFGMTDACEAAEVMLSEPRDPMYGKPEVYDKEFRGTAMEALTNHLIPFPYKVAKTLDPDCYRNIEYDVWSRENRISRKPSSSSKVSRIFHASLRSKFFKVAFFFRQIANQSKIY